MVWSVGKQLQDGKYIIQDDLGRGGYGTTYKVLNTLLNQEFVIKTPNEYLKHDPEYDKYVERFIKEARMLERFSQNAHRNIVKVQELFQEDETYCLVMDFVPGENLFQVVKRRGALPENEAIKCIRQIGEALVVVHQAALTHRDAHPGNIILHDTGHAVLIDFGIAKELIPATLSSTADRGNEIFAPYDQLYKGNRKPNVDVYCLAATLYFVVTGQYPTNSVIRRLENTPLIPPKQIRKEISDRLNTAILQGMALEERDRPPSMQAWLKLLDPPAPFSPPPLVPPKFPAPRTQAPRSAPLPIPKPSRRKPIAPRRSVEIPWRYLFVYLVSYVIPGVILVMLSPRLEVLALGIAWAVAVVMIVAWAGSVAVEHAGKWFVTVGVAVVVGWTVNVAGTGAWLWAGVVVLSGVSSGKVLLESLSRINTFLILVTTSAMGLCLGASVQWALTHR